MLTMYIHTSILVSISSYLCVCVCIKHEFILMSQILIKYHRVHTSLPPCLSVNSLPKSITYLINPSIHVKQFQKFVIHKPMREMINQSTVFMQNMLFFLSLDLQFLVKHCFSKVTQVTTLFSYPLQCVYAVNV